MVVEVMLDTQLCGLRGVMLIVEAVLVVKVVLMRQLHLL